MFSAYMHKVHLKIKFQNLQFILFNPYPKFSYLQMRNGECSCSSMRDG